MKNAKTPELKLQGLEKTTPREPGINSVLKKIINKSRDIGSYASKDFAKMKDTWGPRLRKVTDIKNLLLKPFNQLLKGDPTASVASLIWLPIHLLKALNKPRKLSSSEKIRLLQSIRNNENPVINDKIQEILNKGKLTKEAKKILEEMSKINKEQTPITPPPDLFTYDNTETTTPIPSPNGTTTMDTSHLGPVDETTSEAPETPVDGVTVMNPTQPPDETHDQPAEAEKKPAEVNA